MSLGTLPILTLIIGLVLLCLVKTGCFSNPDRAKDSSKMVTLIGITDSLVSLLFTVANGIIYVLCCVA